MYRRFNFEDPQDPSKSLQEFLEEARAKIMALEEQVQEQAEAIGQIQQHTLLLRERMTSLEAQVDLLKKAPMSVPFHLEMLLIFSGWFTAILLLLIL